MVDTSRGITYLQAITDAQREEMRRDQRVIIMGQELRRQVYGASAGLLDEFGPSRVRDTPISEAAVCGAAVGAAMTGLRPIVDLTIACFVYVAMDQLVSQAAKSRYMFGGQVAVPVVFRVPMYYGRALAAHHSDRPYPLFMHIPGFKVIVPSTPYDMKGLLKAAIRDDDPVVCFEDSMLWAKKGPVPDEDYVVPLGRAQVKRVGSDVTIVAIAGSVVFALEAADALAAEGIKAEVIDPRTLKPLDANTILMSVAKTGRLVIVDPAHRTCGAASEIAAIVAEEQFESLRAPIVRITTPDVHIPFSPALELPLYPDAQKIIAAARRTLQLSMTKTR